MKLHKKYITKSVGYKGRIVTQRLVAKRYGGGGQLTG
jgi:hypothetical protein